MFRYNLKYGFVLIFVHYSDTIPQYYIVPLCNNRSGTPEAAKLSIYRLPLKDSLDVSCCIISIILLTSMLNKNTLSVKKVRGQSEATWKQVGATKS